MTALFADTFYWIALVDFTDSAHQRVLPKPKKCMFSALEP
jgi:hypothetical protein